MAIGRSADGRRWMAVGRCIGTDTGTAARTAVRAAVVEADAKLILVFSSISHDPDALLREVHAFAPGVPVVGCSTHGEIAPGGPADDSITVAALGGPGFTVSTRVAEHVSGRQRAAGAELARSALPVDEHPRQVLLLLTDGQIRDQETILRGTYGVLGAAVPLFGGAAADGWRMTGGYLFADDRVVTDAAVAVAIASDAPLAITARHGWTEVGEPMIVTESRDGRVITLDDQPALDTYLSRLGAPDAAYTDAAALQEFALAHPLGVQRRRGLVARNLSTEIDLEGRSIGGGGTLDYGGLTWAMTGDTESILEATDVACRDAIDALDGYELLGMLTFSCAALRQVLGDDGIEREQERIGKWADGAPYAGFYTYGEIARVRGIDGFHNQTLAVLALA